MQQVLYGLHTKHASLRFNFTQVVDLVEGNRVGPDQKGEICVKTNTMMIGYLNNEEATKNFYDSEGFAKMGDVGYHDKLGKIFFVVRIKEMIK